MKKIYSSTVKGYDAQGLKTAIIKLFNEAMNRSKFAGCSYSLDSIDVERFTRPVSYRARVKLSIEGTKCKTFGEYYIDVPTDTMISPNYFTADGESVPDLVYKIDKEFISDTQLSEMSDLAETCIQNIYSAFDAVENDIPGVTFDTDDIKYYEGSSTVHVRSVIFYSCDDYSTDRDSLVVGGVKVSKTTVSSELYEHVNIESDHDEIYSMIYSFAEDFIVKMDEVCDAYSSVVNKRIQIEDMLPEILQELSNRYGMTLQGRIGGKAGVYSNAVYIIVTGLPERHLGMDNDMYVYIDLKYANDPAKIKRAIVQKLNERLGVRSRKPKAPFSDAEGSI